MPQISIENPIINSPFDEPKRHFPFDEQGTLTSGTPVNGRRKSTYLTPIPPSKKRGGQKTLFETTPEKVEENELINQIRQRVSLWRDRGYPYITKTTKMLLDYWTNPEREKRLFFCQIEALETAIYIAEAAKREDVNFIEEKLTTACAEANPDIFRIAFKMATGSGKTIVMAMLIAWQALNKFANPRDQRFTDAFLIITPGITIRDRLQVLKPNISQNYYKQRNILSADQIVQLHQAKIVITNFHTFLPRETVDAASLTKAILSPDGSSPFTEAPGQVVRRVCRELGNRRNIVVMNDEAHHCYQHKIDGEEEKLTGDDRVEAEKREQESRVWISGIRWIVEKISVKTVYDLSATPFFLRGSGYPEGKLFPWVVSDFALIDAIESGIVKIPRVPVADDAMTGNNPVNRDLWINIRDSLPKRKGKRDENSVPNLPDKLAGALLSLYSSYREYHELWEEQQRKLDRGEVVTAMMPPPVMIVVCSNTMVSKMVYDWISGYEKIKDGIIEIVAGNLELFRNENGRLWLPRPNSILVDSEQLESGEGMKDDFKRIAAKEIDTFKAEYRQRYPERDPEAITDEDLMREVMNTVGKPGMLGGNVQCVVSVSMLTEGWDANTVTHILGVRAFSTQLICEQVVGRALRRISYIPNENGMFEPEYAEIYGVPFSFIPTAGLNKGPTPARQPTHIYALPERAALEITFPRVIGYRYDLRDPKLTAQFSYESILTISPVDVPTMTENAPFLGESSVQTLDELERRRVKEVEFLLAKLVLEKYFRENGNTGEPKLWYFPQLLRIAHEWVKKCVVVKDGCFPQMLLLIGYANNAAGKIHHAIVAGSSNKQKSPLLPILDQANPTGASTDIDFETTRPIYQTNANKCQINFVPTHSNWEAKMAQTLEDMREVIAYVKNDGMDFTIPYTFDGGEHNYIPDFIVKLNIGAEQPLNLIIEVTGAKDAAKDAKVSTAKTLWIPAINGIGQFGSWEFVEIRDVYSAQTIIRRLIAQIQLTQEQP